MAKILNLTDTARSIVYNAIVAALKADVGLSAVTPAITWMTFLGEHQRETPFVGPYPSIELLPGGSDAMPEATTIQYAPFVISAIVTTPGLDVRDLLNLWGAIEYAIFPGDGSKTLNNTIRAALTAAATAQSRPIGSLSSIRLSAPLVKVSPNTAGSEFLTCQGYITADLYVPK